jgi:hypothetical protein
MADKQQIESEVKLRWEAQNATVEHVADQNVVELDSSSSNGSLKSTGPSPTHEPELPAPDILLRTEQPLAQLALDCMGRCEYMREDDTATANYYYILKSKCTNGNLRVREMQKKMHDKVSLLNLVNMCGDLGIQVDKKDKVEISFLIAFCFARSDESQNGDEE